MARISLGRWAVFMGVAGAEDTGAEALAEGANSAEGLEVTR